ncbi:MAG: PEP/pyruvate-binding domain-containing protein [Patescibacteria group bacterium]
MRIASYITWFSEVDKEDVALVGGKGAALGEATRAGFSVPNGFIVTSYAYYDFILENNLAAKIKHLLKTVDFFNPDSLEHVSLDIRKEIIKSKISQELAYQVNRAYRRLSGTLSDALVAVRSSSTIKDQAYAPFAGQLGTFLNVKGDASVILKIKEVWASLFSGRAIFYRHENKLDHLRIGVAVPVQKMIESEKSGVMFTIDPVTGDKTTIVIEAIYGLGELIAQGEVTRDHYKVNKIKDLIIEKNIVSQKFYLKKVGIKNKIIKVASVKAEKQKISNDKILELARIGKKLEKHYYFPQDVEWAIEKGKIYIIKIRPVTTVKSARFNPTTKLGARVQGVSKHEVLVGGYAASPGIASGYTKVIKNLKEINRVSIGDVLVVDQTNTDYVAAMKKAIAIVTERGGRVSHAAIAARELGIPAIVGAEFATKILKTGIVITVNGTKGQVYKGGYLQNITV